MAVSGYTGISYPFRVTSQGGVAMSTTSAYEVPHIEESIEQILGTRELERPMEPGIGTSIDNLMFEPNDEDLQTLLTAQIVEALEEQEERIEVGENDVEYSVVTERDGEYLYATITYYVIKYDTYYTSNIKLGEVKR